MTPELLGVVLAGGASRRMATDKAWVSAGGEPMLVRVLTALARATSDVLVVGRSDSSIGWPTTPDDAPGPRGPLLGIATALRHAGGRGVLAVAVDHPFVRSETLRQLAHLAQPGWAVVPVANGVRQVTCAAYPAGCADNAARELEQDGSLQRLLDRLEVREVPPAEWRAWGEDGRSWFSVDDPLALREAERRFAAPALSASRQAGEPARFGLGHGA